MSDASNTNPIHDLEPVFLEYNRDKLEKSNYPYVYLDSVGVREWQNIHSWCTVTFGTHRYTWAGNKFWFMTDDHLLLFLNVWMLDSVEDDLIPW